VDCDFIAIGYFNGKWLCLNILHLVDKLAQEAPDALEYAPRRTRIVSSRAEHRFFGETRLHLTGARSGGPPAGCGSPSTCRSAAPDCGGR
jgi:hypothetical protein